MSDLPEYLMTQDEKSDETDLRNDLLHASNQELRRDLRQAEAECKELRQAMRNLSRKYNELSAENERLKRCGSCDHNGSTHCCHPAIMESGEYIQTGNVGRMNECHFTPSRWAERIGT